VMFFGPDLDRLFVPTIDPSFLGREPAEGDGWCYVIDGLGVRAGGPAAGPGADPDGVDQDSGDQDEGGARQGGPGSPRRW